MRQHFSVARLFWKKSVAIILGILSIFGFSSAMAEKLDTTFVLDMVIDSTPCYYIKYNSAGQITNYGRYLNDDFFRVNTGYVKNENGEVLDTLFYVCDRVTKQWSQVSSINHLSPLPEYYHNYSYKFSKLKFHENGMAKSFTFTDSINHSRVTYDLETLEQITVTESKLSLINSDKFSTDGFLVSSSFTKYDISGMTHAEIEDEFESVDYDTRGNVSKKEAYYNHVPRFSYQYINTYDDRNNLVSSKTVNNLDYFEGQYSYFTEYFYDSLDRRVKTVHYDSTGDGIVVSDSIVYFHGHYSSEYVRASGHVVRPKFISFSVANVPFSLDYFKEVYEGEWYCDTLLFINYLPRLIKYQIPEGVTATESYMDDDSGLGGLLTITLCDDADTTIKTYYYIDFEQYDSIDQWDDSIFKKGFPYIESLKIGEESVPFFNAKVFEYEFDKSYTPGLVEYVLPEGVTATEIYDDSTRTLQIITYKSYASIHYFIHFWPKNGVSDFSVDNGQLYVSERTISIDGLNSQVSVYDMMGRLVGSGSGESVRVPVRQSGTYVVQANGQSAKVVVK